MGKNQKSYLWLIFLTLIAITAMAGCASIQSPTGGPRDSVSPQVIEASPPNLTRNFNSKGIRIKFSELIKLNNENTEISISPDLEKSPTFRVKKELLDINFLDTLEHNTTYTINFGKAIGDVNENNLLKNYTYVFSTGPTIDSLSLSGTVRSSLSKEKSDIIVFLLPVSQDSLFGKKKASIFTTADSAGNFKLEHLKENNYLLYALKEQGQGDRIYNSQNEEIGFYPDTIKLNKDIKDVTVETFKEIPGKLAIKDRKIEKDGRISFILNKPATDPNVTILNPPSVDKTKITEWSPTLDTALVWIPDLTFDSLEVSILDKGTSIDTVILRRNKRDSYSHDVTLTNNLTGNKLRPGSELVLTASGPLKSINPSKFTLLEDSVRVNGLTVTRVENTTRKLLLKYPWKNKRSYIINIGEGSATDIFGSINKPSTILLSVDDPENYGNVTLKIKLPDSAKYLVEILRDEKVITTEKIPASGTVNFLKYPTAKYRFRIVYDTNSNEKWDTGSVKERRLPEKIWEYEKDITLRPNWDIEETITVPDQ